MPTWSSSRPAAGSTRGSGRVVRAGCSAALRWRSRERPSRSSSPILPVARIDEGAYRRLAGRVRLLSWLSLGL